jgi:hypothetical protein
MSLLDAYRRKLEIQIQEHKVHLDLLKAKAREVAAQGKILGSKELLQAEKHLDHVRARFKELKGAGGQALGEMRIGVGKALADLRVSTQKAASHFDTHQPPKAKPAPAKPRKRTKPAGTATKQGR